MKVKYQAKDCHTNQNSINAVPTVAGLMRSAFVWQFIACLLAVSNFLLSLRSCLI